MARRNVVVIGASAGGVEALRSLVSRLPHDFPAAVVVVVHTPAAGAMALARILDRSGPLPATRAEKDTALVPGRILVAPGGHHLVVEDHTARLSQGPRENGYRPSVDVTFRTAANALGNQVVAMVLSGSLDDGAAGAVAVKQRGGVVIVQSPDEAMHAGMPNAALAATTVDQVLELADMPAALAALLAETVDGISPAPSGLLRKEVAVDELDADALLDPDHPGEPSGWTCPDCHGSLLEIRDGQLTRFRCRVGHAWSPQSLMAQKAGAVESALWVALRSLEEKASLSDELSRQATERGHALSAQSFGGRAEEARRSARTVRWMIDELAGSDLPSTVADEPDEVASD